MEANQTESTIDAKTEKRKRRRNKETSNDIIAGNSKILKIYMSIMWL